MTNPSDEFDERLRRAASEYNRPSETPRERMWAEIRAQRTQRGALRPDTPAYRRPLWYMPAAAAALLVIGIAIGRMYEHVTTAPAHPRVIAAHADSGRTPAGVHSIDSTPKAESVHPAITSAPRRDVAVAPPGNPAPRREPMTVDTASGSRPYVPNSATMAYRLAVVEHLAGTEAMLTSFRAAAKRGEVDAQITNWARNLLTTTRLLQGSTAQEDPTMKRLLDDLELVLVQIAQYTSASPHRAEELEFIEHSIERRGVIGKLHTTIPARLGPAGT